MPRYSKWMSALNEDQIMAMMLAATTPIENPVNTRPKNLVDCGVNVMTGGRTLTSMCFWRCLAKALDMDPAFIVTAMGITASHPASDDEIHTFVRLFPASVTVLEPGETRRYPSNLGEAQVVKLWLDQGHYKLIRH